MIWLFWLLLGLVGLQRLSELVLNRRNQDRLLSRGGRLVASDGYRAIVATHLAWFVAMAAEALWAPWSGAWTGTWPLLGAYAIAEALRLWTMATMGERWTTRVIVVPGSEPIETGPFRFLDHPIYVAVSIELAALPLAFGLPATAIVISIANAIALRRRIRVEERALAETGSAREPTSGGA